MAGAQIHQLDPAVLPETTSTYTHGTLVTNAERVVFVSGQVPWDRHAALPPDFASQCRLVWRNVLSVLAEAGMSATNLAKVTTYLSDRRYRDENARIRQEFLGEHRPALTIIVCDIYDPAWLLEIEAIAVA